MARKRKEKKTKYQVAIIGEGPTEWHYFNDMKQVKRFPYKITPDLPKHSDYKCIFSKAKKLVNEGFNLVFCVLDLDVFKADAKKEEKYINEKNKLEKNDRIIVCETMPCIEYWFLIHYKKKYSSKIYPNYSSLEKELKKYLPKYEKSNEYLKKIKIFQTLTKSGDMEKAVEFSEQLRQEKEDSDNNLFPFSEIDLLLKKLIKTV